jgi:MFS family permease
MGKVPVVSLGAALAAASALLAAAPVGPALTTLSLIGAGLGIAALYPVALDRLMKTPGLGLSRGAALGSAASGAAVLGAPVLLGFLSSRASLRAGFIAALPLLLLVWLLRGKSAHSQGR